jgi:immune inhibitor A
MSIRHSLSLILLGISIFATTALAIPGMPPSVYEALELPAPASFTEPTRPEGVDIPVPPSSAASVTVRPLVIFVDFDDKPADIVLHQPEDYGRLLFRQNQEPGSFVDYWNEVSGGNARVIANEDEDVDSTWLRLSGFDDASGDPLNYTFYTNANYGYGEYPRNSQGLVNGLLPLTDSRINFAAYDNDGPDGIPRSANPEYSDDDGFVDALFIVHAGWGGEQSYDPNDIWSCKWDLTSADGPGAYSTDDGVQINDFMLVPEELYDDENDGDELLITIGTFCHNFGYLLGLPALYDTTPVRWSADSYGIGRWGLMGYGAWTGIVVPPQRFALPGNCPVHPCAWSKHYLDWVEISHATQGREQPHVIYRAESAAPAGATRFLKITIAGPEEYFLLENRQQEGFDRGLSFLTNVDDDEGGDHSGLLIWHIDENLIAANLASGTVNADRLHKGVDLEEADGLSDLDYKVNLGDDGDPFPGYSGNRTFGPTTTPNSLPYDSSGSTCYIERISDSANPMTLYVTSIRNPLNEETIVGPNPYYPGQHDHLTFFFKTGVQVTVRIYTLTGDLVRTIGADEVDEAFGQATWVGDNDAGNQVATGLYFYTVDSGDHHVGHGKFTIVR